MQTNTDTTGLEDLKDTDGEGSQRSEKRFKDLSNKVAMLAQEKEESLKQHEAEKAELQKKAQDAEFKANFSDLREKYPQSREFEADIKAKVSTGYSLEDAIVSTLNSKGKLQASKEEVRSSSFGGSADTALREARANDPTFGGDRAKMREELVRLEREGEIGMRF